MVSHGHMAALLDEIKGSTYSYYPLNFYFLTIFTSLKDHILNKLILFYFYSTLL